MGASNHLGRREFLGAAAAVGAAAIIPRSVLGGPKHVPPSEKVQIAYVGCGSQGLAATHAGPGASRRSRSWPCAIPIARATTTRNVGRNELNDKIRKFLGDANWAAGARGGLCGREVGLELVNRHYAKQGQAGTCQAYADFREMLDKQKGLDAVYIMTPDHLHGVIAIRAMRQGKHVITHKPISNVFDEVRHRPRHGPADAAWPRQLFCMADVPTTPMLCEWLSSGVIGPVREVHNWSTRPFWPQGMTELPAEKPAVPAGFEWDLWLGPASYRPYHPAYTHAVFRGWYDFGTGALGDMGHYSFLPDLPDAEAGLAFERRGWPQPVLEDRGLHLAQADQSRVVPAGLDDPLGVSRRGASFRPWSCTGTTAASVRPCRRNSRPTARRCPRRACCWSAIGGRSWPASSGTIRV